MAVNPYVTQTDNCRNLQESRPIYLHPTENHNM